MGNSQKKYQKDIILASKQGSTTCKVFLHYAKARDDSNTALITSDVRKIKVFCPLRHMQRYLTTKQKFFQSDNKLLRLFPPETGTRSLATTWASRTLTVGPPSIWLRPGATWSACGSSLRPAASPRSPQTGGGSRRCLRQRGRATRQSRGSCSTGEEVVLLKNDEDLFLCVHAAPVHEVFRHSSVQKFGALQVKFFFVK